LIDGFPRNQDNVDGWNRVVGDQAYFHSLLFFECTFETLEKRLLQRGKDSGRIDDNIEAIKKRFNTYAAETKPVIDYFDAQNKVNKIDAEKSVQEVFGTLKAIFDPILKK
jgi:adenylate kinase family enzyme